MRDRTSAEAGATDDKVAVPPDEVIAAGARHAAIDMRDAVVGRGRPVEPSTHLVHAVTLALDVPMAMVTRSKPGTDVLSFVASIGVAESWAQREGVHIADTCCQIPISTARPLLVADARLEPRIATLAVVAALNIRAYAGLPLFSSTGTVLGTLCAMDIVPHVWTDQQIAILSDLAALAGADLEMWTALGTQAARAEKLQTAVDAMADGVVIYDEEVRAIYSNQAVHTLLGVDRHESLAAVPVDERHTRFDIRDAQQRQMQVADLPPHRVVRGEDMTGSRAVDLRMRTMHGTEVEVNVSASPLRDARGHIIGGVAVYRDVTEAKRAQEQLLWMAHHDTLTGLANRALFQERLTQALHTAPRIGRPVALLLVDLDRFKEVNDTLGHEAGDSVLRQVGKRLRGTLRVSDTVARLGGDEFAVLLPATNVEGAMHVAQSLHAALDVPLPVDDHTLVMGGSIGLVCAPEHGTDPAILMRRADMAMYAAKHSGGGVSTYRPEQDEHSATRLALASQLRSAIAGQELELYYQPIAMLADSRVRNVEALVRWHHPTRGLLHPDAFIPLAEQTGLIVPLAEWVLDEALRCCRAWQQAGRRIGVAVNLSMRTLHEAQLPALVGRLLDVHGVAAGNLTLEMGESAVMMQPHRTQAVLRGLAGLGVRLSIDDFGTGYSSLSLLRQLPVHEVKVDSSLTGAGGADPQAGSIMTFIAQLGRTLGLSVVAEGVETHEAWDMAAVAGCDAAQGYLFSNPLPGHDLDEWLDAHPARTI